MRKSLRQVTVLLVTVAGMSMVAGGAWSQDEEFVAPTDEGLIEFSSDQKYVAGEMFEDPSGNEMWSVNVVIADENNEFTKDSISLKPYV